MQIVLVILVIIQINHILSKGAKIMFYSCSPEPVPFHLHRNDTFECADVLLEWTTCRNYNIKLMDLCHQPDKILLGLYRRKSVGLPEKIPREKLVVPKIPVHAKNNNCWVEYVMRRTNHSFCTVDLHLWGCKSPSWICFRLSAVRYKPSNNHRWNENNVFYW